MIKTDIEMTPEEMRHQIERLTKEIELNNEEMRKIISTNDALKELVVRLAARLMGVTQ